MQSSGAPGTFRFELTSLGARLMGAYFLFWFGLFALSRWAPTSLAASLRLPGRPQGPSGFEVSSSYPLSEALLLHLPGGNPEGPGFAIWQLMSGPLTTPPLAFGSLVSAFVVFGFFAAPVERFLGKTGFLTFWFLASFAGALTALAFALAVGPSVAQFGPWPSVLGIVTLCCLMTPEATVAFFLVVQVRMKWIAWSILAWVVIQAFGMTEALARGGLAGGYDLGGLALAWWWIKGKGGGAPLRWNWKKRRSKRFLRAVDSDLQGGGGPNDGVFH